MKEPTRLLDSTTESFETELLRAGRHDAPSAEARQRALATLGIIASGAGTGMTLATTASATAISASAAPATLGSTVLVAAKTGASLGGAALTKWVVITAVGATLVATAARPLWSPATKSAAAEAASSGEPLTTTSPVSSAHKAPHAPVAPPDDTPQPFVEATAALASAPVPTQKPTSAAALHRELPATPAWSAVAPPPQVSLTDEVTALEEIRHAVGAKQGPRAMQLLNVYGERFTKPNLGLEALVLRVDALLLTGDRPRAVKLAQTLLTQYPGSPYAERWRTVVASSAQ